MEVEVEVEVDVRRKLCVVPLRFCISESFCTSISWHLQH